MTMCADPRLAVLVFLLLAGKPSGPMDWSRLDGLLDALGDWLAAIDGGGTDEAVLLDWIDRAGVPVEADAAGDLRAGVSAAGLVRLRDEMARLMAAA